MGKAKFSNFMIILLGSTGGILFGYDNGIIGGALIFLTKDFNLTSLGSSLTVSSILIGAFIGAPIAGYVADLAGRRVVIFAMGVVFLVGSILSYIVVTDVQLIVVRLILGLSVGGSSALVPLYLSEMAPTHMRGMLASWDQLMINTGTLLSTIVGFLLAVSGNWRLMFGLAIIPSIIMVLGVLVMPESPRWLITKDRVAEARAIMLKTRSADETETELAGIVAANSLESNGLKDLAKPYMRKILVLAMVVLAIQQFSGINTILFYLPTILTGMGVSVKAAMAVNIGSASLGIICTLIFSRLIDKTGRRPMLLRSSIMLSAALFTLSMCAFVGGKNPTIATGLVFLVAVYWFRIFYSAGWGPGAWVYVSEIFPLRVRGRASSIAIMANWGANFLVAFMFPLMTAKFGIGVTLLFFVGFNILGFFYVKAKLFETKGLSLEQIEEHFRGLDAGDGEKVAA